MIMKKLILFLLILCNCLICNAGGISKEVLTANTWKVVYPDFHGKQTHMFKFNLDNTLTIKVTFHQRNYTGTAFYRYYLTDMQPTAFEMNDNIDNNSGRYVVVKNKKDKEKNKPSFCWENISTDKNIIEFKDQTGQLWILEKQ